MKANFVVGWINGQPDLPPMEDMEGGIQIVYLNDKGIKVGGYSVLSSHAETVLVQVNASAITIDAMKTDTTKYLWVEDIDEQTN